VVGDELSAGADEAEEREATWARTEREHGWGAEVCELRTRGQTVLERKVQSARCRAQGERALPKPPCAERRSGQLQSSTPPWPLRSLPCALRSTVSTPRPCACAASGLQQSPRPTRRSCAPHLAPRPASPRQRQPVLVLKHLRSDLSSSSRPVGAVLPHLSDRAAPSASLVSSSPSRRSLADRGRLEGVWASVGGARYQSAMQTSSTIYKESCEPTRERAKTLVELAALARCVCSRTSFDQDLDYSRSLSFQLRRDQPHMMRQGTQLRRARRPGSRAASPRQRPAPGSHDAPHWSMLHWPRAAAESAERGAPRGAGDGKERRRRRTEGGEGVGGRQGRAWRCGWPSRIASRVAVRADQGWRWRVVCRGRAARGDEAERGQGGAGAVEAVGARARARARALRGRSAQGRGASAQGRVVKQPREPGRFGPPQPWHPGRRSPALPSPVSTRSPDLRASTR